MAEAPPRAAGGAGGEQAEKGEAEEKREVAREDGRGKLWLRALKKLFVCVSCESAGCQCQSMAGC